MLSFLVQCCHQPKFHQENEIDVNSIETKDPRNTNTDNDSFYDMNVMIDYSSDNTSYYSESLTSNSVEENKQDHYIYTPLYIEYSMKHNRDIQRLPGPTITVINMAVERVLKDPHWEQVEPFEIQYNDSILHPRFTKIKNTIATDFSSCQQNIIHEHQPIIYFSQANNNDDRLSMLSEMHGSDSETIDIFKPKQSIHLPKGLFQKENDYQLPSHIDNIEARVKDFLSLPSNSSQIRVNLPKKGNKAHESKTVKFSILSAQLNNQIHY